MKLLTKNTDYAIRALIHLARNKDKCLSSTRISQEEKIPLPYLRRILQILTGENFISTKEGAGGGVKLRRRPDSIGITSLIRMFQGEVQLAECMFRKQFCHNRKTCVLRKRLKAIEKMVIGELEGITIGSLLKDLEEEKR